jgi:SHS2 domain-containing protein
MDQSRVRFAEHTGEVEMHLEGESLAELFEAGARGLAELLAEDAHGPPTGPDEHVTLAASDPEALLVDWLNELVYRGEVHKRVYADVTIQRIDGRALSAIIRGREPTAPRTAVKAATWHGLRVRPRERGYEATVVLDV